MSADNIILVQAWKDGWTVAEVGFSQYSCFAEPYFEMAREQLTPKIIKECETKARHWFRECKLYHVYNLAIRGAEAMIQEEEATGGYVEYGIETSVLPLEGVDFDLDNIPW